MVFEKFIKSGRDSSPKITIRKNGQISFNAAFNRKHGVDNSKYAVLYFDQEKKRIGIQLTNDENEEGKIKIQKGKNFTTVSAKAFSPSTRSTIQLLYLEYFMESHSIYSPLC